MQCYLRNAYPENDSFFFYQKKKLELTYKMFLVETALDTEGDRLKKAKRIAYLDSSERV